MYRASIDPKTGRPVLDEESQINPKSHHGLIYGISWLIAPFYSFFMGLHISGRKNIPKTGAIIASNHKGNRDGIEVLFVVRRPIHFFGKSSLSKGILSPIARSIGFIPIDRSRRNTAALKFAAKQLKKGKLVGIMPEGTVNRTSKPLLPFKFGAVKMAAETGKPLVPTALYKKKIIFGEPFYANPKNLEASNQELALKIEQLLEIAKKPREIRQFDGKAQDLLKPILLPLIKLIYRPKIIGKSHIPKHGPTIIVSNHKHDFDPFLIMSGRPNRRTHFLAKNDCTEWKIAKGIASFGVIFVDRSAEADKSKIKNQVAAFLNQGRTLALFPEGTRNKTDKLLIDFKMGAVSFAAKNNATLVPAAIIGEYKAFPKRSSLKIIFDKPLKLHKNDLEKTNENLKKRIEKLLIDNHEEKYRPKIYAHYQAKAEKEQAKSKGEK
jgi:1-acyl-sn-glycerol-3-phosphate acyltransferase